MPVPFWKTEFFGTAMSYLISQMPPRVGYRLADMIAHVAANDVMSPGHRAMRVNQWVVHGGQASPRKLRQVVRQVYYNQGRAIYDFYHYLNHPEDVQRLVSMTPEFTRVLEETKQQKQGTLLLMPHLTGFNLGGLLPPMLGYRILTLSYPNPTRGYRLQNKFRSDRGLEVEPMSASSWQHARERLQQGGIVLTGVDRPLADPSYAPRFFGRPSALPVAYMQLALHTNARVFVIAFRTNPDRTCELLTSPQVELERRADPHEEMLVNTEKVLLEVEKFILQDPTQWVMFFPVWPGADAELPAKFRVK